MGTRNMNKYWFVPKFYGCGFVPVSWEAWLMYLFFMFFCFGSAFFHGFWADELSTVATVGFVLDIGVYVILFSLIAIPKTKGVVKRCGGRTSK